ncbi:hypothetical protein [Arenibacter latericius]|uniref:hypothetical protein n=1 Tax=Arenibacter latericius TaxID=86104 RepID=UPI0004162754|nr:hypothetical protein [Arenibacter latericius]
MRTFKIIGILLIIGISSSCNSDDDISNEQVLNGIYTESLPYAGTHQLHFVDDNTLILKARNSTDEEFAYQINENIITLKPIRDLSQAWDLEINISNSSTFDIQNIFYVSIPEDDNPIEFVTFKK